MIIGLRLRQLRVERGMLQRDIEKRTGLARCYISRMENGYIIPGIDTLQKLAAALEVPLHILFYDGEGKPEPPEFIGPLHKDQEEPAADDPVLNKLRALLPRIEERDRQLMLYLLQRMAAGSRPPYSIGKAENGNRKAIAPVARSAELLAR